MRQLLIIGGSGGIGSALIQASLQRWPDLTVQATSRARQPELRHPRLQWSTLDLGNDQSLQEWLQHISSEAPAFDALVFASGWLHDSEYSPEKSTRDLDITALDRALRINASAPVLLLGKLAPLLTQAAGSSAERARMLVLSAKVGSIGDNSLGGWHAYRMSKAALNMGVRNLGIEFARSARKPLVAAVHPGTTHTPLSEPFAKRGLSVVPAEQCAQRLLDFLEGMNETHQGRFWHWDGSPLAW